MSLVRQVEKKIDETLRHLFGGESQTPEGREPLEVYRAALDDLANHIQPTRRGRKVLPFNRLLLRVAVPDAARRPAFEATFGDATALQQEVLEILRTHDADAPPDLQVATELASPDETASLPRGYEWIGTQQEQAPAPVTTAPGKLEVVFGHATPPVCVLDKPRVNLGRLAELLNEHNHLVRRNDLSFTEASEGPNSTVSRAHAHILRDESTGEYRIYDENSSYGTNIFRDGRLIPVPAGGRGMKLNPGDEIYLGQARIRFDLES